MAPTGVPVIMDMLELDSIVKVCSICIKNYTRFFLVLFKYSILVGDCQKIYQCSFNGYCNNVTGAYHCYCLSGYSGNGTVCNGKLCTNFYFRFYFALIEFSDINECITGNACNASASCTNTPGNYTCACKTGFRGDGFRCDSTFFSYSPFSYHNLTAFFRKISMSAKRQTIAARMLFAEIPLEDTVVSVQLDIEVME